MESWKVEILPLNDEKKYTGINKNISLNHAHEKSVRVDRGKDQESNDLRVDHNFQTCVLYSRRRSKWGEHLLGMHP